MSTLNPSFNLINVISHDRKIHNEINKKKDSIIEVTWATSDKEIKEAQKLRFKVFSEEMGANLISANKKIDQDIFDNYCEHLIVRNKINEKVKFAKDKKVFGVPYFEIGKDFVPGAQNSIELEKIIKTNLN